LLYPYLIYHYLINIILRIIDVVMDYIPDDSLMYSDIN
jgi:hypothetical protein